MWLRPTPGRSIPAPTPARPFLFMGEPFLGALLLIVGIVWLTLIVTLVTVIRRLPELANRTL